MYTKLAYVARCLSRGTQKKFETYVINAIYAKLNNPNLEIKTQQYVNTKEGRRFIDLYFPQLKIAIEINEGYHDNPWQKIQDKKRMDSIKLAILESTILDAENDIKFHTIPIVKNGVYIKLEELNNMINDVVNQINLMILEYEKKQPLIWFFENDKKLDEIINRGYLNIGDSFSSMKDILYIFGKKVKGWQRCTYKEKGVWSPTLSVEGSDRAGWVNTITEDLTEIFESGVKGKKSKTIGDVEWDKCNNTKRIVFLKFKDALGNNGRRFIGVYVADRFDSNKQAEVWKRIETKCSLKN